MNNRNCVVVTGVSSFIGTHLSVCFSNMGYEVIATISRPKSNYRGIRFERIKHASSRGVKVEVLDITCPESVTDFINRVRPRYWIHHAAWAKNYQSTDYDLDYAHSLNVTPLDYVYSALKNVECIGVVLTGSSAEYSDSSDAAEESDVCAPSMPYGRAKLAQTLRAKQLAEYYSLPTRVARVFIPFGPLDAPGKLLPSVLDALGNNQPISLTNCSQVRDFLFIDDLVVGYSCLLTDFKRKTYFDVFNLSSGEPVTLKRLLLDIAEIMKVDTKLLRFGERPFRDGDVQSSWGDNGKARDILGWNPEGVRSGIGRYLDATKK